MTETPTSTPAPETPQPTRGQKFTRWFVAIALLITGIGGIAKGLGPYFFLPSCDSSTTADTLKNIFKSKDVELTKVSNSTTLTSTSSDMTCQANIETPDELATIGYRIYWDGWSATVMITKVDAKPK